MKNEKHSNQSTPLSSLLASPLPHLLSTYINMLGINLLRLVFIQAAYGFSATTSTTSSRSNVIFVGGLSDMVSATQLSEDFERRFGNVVDVSIIRGSGKQQPYAFVEFESSQNAQAAILDSSPSALYKDVKTAAPIDTSKRRRSNTSRKTQQTELQYIKDVCFSKLMLHSEHHGQLSSPFS